MKLAVITPTRNRLYTLSLLHKYILRQTRKPDWWIIATDGELPKFPESSVEVIFSKADYAGSPVASFTKNLLRGINLAEEKGADMVLIMEDDDWYSSDYVEKMEEACRFADVVGNQPTKSINIVSGSMKYAQHGYIVLAQLGFKRSANDLFRKSTRQCLNDNNAGVDKTFFALVKLNDISCAMLQSPSLYFGLKGIYDLASRQSQGLTEQHRRHKKYLKGHLLRIVYLFSKIRKDQDEQNVYDKLRGEIGDDDAASYRDIILGGKVN